MTAKKIVAKASPKIKTIIKKPEAVKAEPFSFKGEEPLKEMGVEKFTEISGLVKKFQGRFGVRLAYVPKFKSFKLMRGCIHIDWITLNDLMKRYDCRIPPVSMSSQPQRPYIKDRIY